MRQGRISTLDLAGQRRAEDPIGDESRMPSNEPDRIGWNCPYDELIRQVKPRIGDFQQRQDVIGAVFLKIEIIKVRIAQFPGVPQHLKHLILRKVQSILPDVAALDRKSTRLNSSHVSISYAVFCLK